MNRILSASAAWARNMVTARRRQPIFLGDRVLAYTHRGQRIFLIPADQDLTISILETGTWEPHVERAIRRLVQPGQTAIDAGANVGYHTIGLADRVGKAGKVHAFEANPDVMRLLRATMFQKGYCDWLGNGRVMLHQNALSDSAGMLTLQSAPDHYGSGHLIATPDGDFGPDYSVHHQVEAVRADEFLADLPAVDFIHMDIEGAEPLALRGASALIARSPRVTLLMEWAVGMMQATAPVAPLVEELSGQGFRFWVVDKDGRGFTPVGATDTLSLPHCDVVVARDDPR